MNDIFSAALAIQSVCARNRWQFCFIGGIAVLRWGEPRFTDDADLTLMTGFGAEEGFTRTLLKEFSARRPDAAGFAQKNRVLLLKGAQGVGIDVALGATPFEARTIERSSKFLFPTGQTLITCSAEDLIVYKCFAGRDKDWLDVDGVLARQQRKLDVELILTELKALAALKEEPEIIVRLERKIARCNKPPMRIKNTKRRSTER